MSKKHIIFLMIALAFCFIQVVSADPVLVETVPDTWVNLGYANHRTNFEYNASSYQFYAWNNASWDGYVYEFSSDGVDWTGERYTVNQVETTKRGRGLAVWQNSTYAFFAYIDSSGAAPNIRYTRGSIGTDGVITWGSEYIASAGVGGQYSSNVAITVTSDTLLPHIIFERNSGRIYEVRCASSDGSGAWTETTLQGNEHAYSKAPTIVQLSSNNIYAIYPYVYDIYGRLWNETAGAWDAVQNIYGVGEWKADELSLSATSDLSNDEIYLSFHGRAGWLDGVYFFQRYNNGSWGSRETIDSGALAHSTQTKTTASLLRDNSTIYTFWDNSDDLTIYYSYKNTSLTTWSTAANLTGTPVNINSQINSLYRFEGVLHGICWEVDEDAANGWIYTWSEVPSYDIIATASPEVNAIFTADGTPYTTPEIVTLSQGSYEFITEQTLTYGSSTYEFDYWLLNSTEYYSATFDYYLASNLTMTIYYVVQADTPYIPPIFDPEAINATWYMRSDTHTIHDNLGYKLHEYQSYTETNDSRYSSTETTSISYAVRIWILDANGNTEEISSGSPVAIVTRDDNSSGILSETWTCPEYSSVIDAVQVKVYQRFGSGAWSLRKIFITEEALLIRFPESTWTFYYYVEQVKLSTNSTFSHGSLSFNSRMIFQYYRISVFEKMTYHLQQFQILSFFVTPWTYYLGTMFYGILLFFFAATAYLRYHSLRAVLAVFWLFGGTGGFLSAMMPAMGLQLSWFILALTLALTIFHLIYGKRT